MALPKADTDQNAQDFDVESTTGCQQMMLSNVVQIISVAAKGRRDCGRHEWPQKTVQGPSQRSG